jgi:hypothetical protein
MLWLLRLIAVFLLVQATAFTSWLVADVAKWLQWKSESTAAWMQGIGSMAAVAAAAGIALWQNERTSYERRLDRSTAACDKYRFDPTIDAAYRRLYDERFSSAHGLVLPDCG